MVNLKSKVFLKFLISYFLLTVILIGSIGFLLYVNSVKNLEQEISYDMLSRLKYIQSIVEEKLVSQPMNLLLARSMDYLNKMDFRDLAEEDSANMDIYELYGVYDDFQSIVKSNDTIESLTMYFVNSNCVISSESGLIMDGNLFHDIQFIKKQKKQAIPFKGRWSNSRDIQAKDDTKSRVNVLTYTMAFPYTAKGEQILAYIYINIYEQAYKGMLKDFSKNHTEGMLIADEHFNPLAAINLPEYSTQQIAKHENEVKNNFRIIQTGNTKTMVSYNQSSINGWWYITLNPIKDFFNLSMSITRIMILVCVSVALLGLLLSFVFSNSLYNPVRELTLALGAHNKSNANKRDEYRMIHDNINQLNQTVGVLKTKLKDNIYMDSLYGRAKQEDDISTEIMQRPNMIVMLLHLVNIEIDASNCIDQILKQVMEPSKEIVILPQSPTEFILIVGYEGEYEDLIMLVNTNLKYKLDESNINFSIAIGSEVQEIQFLHQSFENARKAARYRFVQWKNSVIEYRNTDNYVNFDAHVNFSDLEANLKSGEIKEVRNIIGVTVEKLERQLYSIESIEHVFFQILASISKTILELNVQNSVASYKNIYHEFLKKDTIYEAVQWIYGVCENLIAFTRSKTVNNKEVMFKIKDFIDNNLDKDISLDTLADISFLSPSYISTQFKEVFSAGFSEYISDARLVKAAELLCSTQKLVKDIMEETGYRNQSYFITKFKQKFGMTPNNYRQTK